MDKHGCVSVHSMPALLWWKVTSRFSPFPLCSCVYNYSHVVRLTWLESRNPHWSMRSMPAMWPINGASISSTQAYYTVLLTSTCWAARVNILNKHYSYTWNQIVAPFIKHLFTTTLLQSNIYMYRCVYLQVVQVMFIDLGCTCTFASECLSTAMIVTKDHNTIWQSSTVLGITNTLYIVHSWTNQSYNKYMRTLLSYLVLQFGHKSLQDE